MNQNGYTETVTQLITAAMTMSGILALGEDMDGEAGEAIFALRELNLIASRYNNHSLLQYEQTEINVTTTVPHTSYTIGSGMGYISDRIILDEFIGDSIVFDRDINAGDFGAGQTVKVYDNNGALVVECLALDVGPNLVQIDNSALESLDINTRYIVYGANMAIPDIPCVTPDNIKIIRNKSNDVDYVIDSGVVNDSVEYVTAIPRMFQYIKGSLGLLIFDCKAEIGNYVLTANYGVPTLTLATTLHLPSPVYIDLLQTALAIRMGKMVGRDTNIWAQDLAKLENTVQMTNRKNIDLDRRGRGKFDLASYRYV